MFGGRPRGRPVTDDVVFGAFLLWVTWGTLAVDVEFDVVACETNLIKGLLIKG